MSERDGHGNNGDPRSFLERWSRRKLQQQNQGQAVSKSSSSTDSRALDTPRPASDEPLPAIDELNENSEVSMFLAEGVSEMVKRQALRKLFHLDKFNVVDGLDDYAEDYTGFQPLGKVMTAHQRLREEREKLKQALADEEQSADANEADQGVAAQSPRGEQDPLEESQVSIAADDTDEPADEQPREG